MKKVAVTGSSGFIGKHVLPLLAARNYETYPLKLDRAHPENHLLKIQEIRPDYLLHFAWETQPKLFWHAHSNLDWLKLSLDLIHTFAACGGERVVCAGSCAENFLSTLYAACKESLRLCASALCRDHKVSFAWGRIFFPYGPFEKKERLIPSLIGTLVSQGTFTCSSQNHLRDFLFIEDVAEAFVAILESQAEGTIEIGLGEGVQVGEIVTLIAEKLDAKHAVELFSAPDAPDNPLTLVANPKRLSEEIGFKPKYTLHQGLEKTIHWWRDHLRNGGSL